MSHDDGHGHGAVPAGDEGAHGPVEFPPVPDPRMITPARSDYAQPFVGRGLLWPVLWLGVALAFHSMARRWPAEAHEAGTDAPAHGHSAPDGR